MNSLSCSDPFPDAFWIWPQNFGWDLYNCYALMRKGFTLEATPAEAIFHVSADQAYQLYVNGEFVCRGPARGFQESWPYDTVNLAPYLCAGENVIAVRAYHPGVSSFQYVSRHCAGFILEGNAGGQRVVSDDTWRVRRQQGIERGTVPVSIQLFPQEHIDLRIEPQDWTESGFDDAAWDTPFKRMAYSLPWPSMEPRGIPMLSEVPHDAFTLIGTGETACASGYQHTRDVVGLRHGESIDLQRVDAVTSNQIEIPPTGAHRLRSYLFDLGHICVGNLEITINGAKGGEIFDTLHVEGVNQETLALELKIPDWCRMAFGSRLVCDRGENHHRFYHYYGFRYLLLTVRNSTAPVSAKLRLHTIGYPLRKNGAFESSDPLLNGLWEACERTQRVCSLDAYVDTPWREQAQWWGDARIQAWNTFHLDGDTRLFERGIRQLATQRTPKGLTYGHAPTASHHCVLPDFSLTWILTLWDHYWQTGSLRCFEQHRETALGIFKYFKDNLDPAHNLVKADQRHWLFLDWAQLPTSGCPTLLSLWLLYALERFTEMNSLAGIPMGDNDASAWAGDLRNALRARLNPDGLLDDGIAPDGLPYASASIHAQTLASLLDLAPEHRSAMFSERILPWLRGESTEAIIPSCYWAAYVLDEAIRHGHSTEALACIRREWAEMSAFGTTFERFHGEIGSSSRSHAWSAHPLYLLMRILGGVRQSAPGWSEVDFSPNFLVSNCAVTVPTPHGKIEVRWTKTAEGVHISLEHPDVVTIHPLLPANTEMLASTANRKEWYSRQEDEC